MADAERITLYHGTAHDFAAFGEHSVGLGSEANSALGVHLTEDPAAAADYALAAARDKGASTAVVLVVRAAVADAAVISSRDAFFGHEDGIPVLDKAAFARMRSELAAEGLHAAVADDIGDVAGTWIVFDPARLEVTGRLDIETAYLATPARDFAGVRFDFRAHSAAAGHPAP